MIPYMRMARIGLDHILTGTVRIYDRRGATIPVREADYSDTRIYDFPSLLPPWIGAVPIRSVHAPFHTPATTLQLESDVTLNCRPVRYYYLADYL